MRFKVGVLMGNFEDAIKNVITGYEHQYQQNLAKGAMAVRNEAIKGLRNSSGSLYAHRYNPKRIVRVSDPGEAPNTDTGTLIKSIGWNVDESAGIAEVGTGLAYGKFLEFGTTHMQARPWLYPALERARPRLISIFRQGRGSRQVADGE